MDVASELTNFDVCGSASSILRPQTADNPPWMTRTQSRSLFGVPGRLSLGFPLLLVGFRAMQAIKLDIRVESSA